MIHIIGVTKDKTVEKRDNFTHFDWNQFDWVWVDVEAPTSEELNYIKDTFHLHPASIEYKKEKIRRPKLEHNDDYTFYITHMLEVEQYEIRKQELDFFIHSTFILTIHHEPLEKLDKIRHTYRPSTQYDYWPTYEVFRYILDAIVENYTSIIDHIEEELETIEDNSEKKKMDDLMMDLFNIRKILLHIGYTVSPMKDMLDEMIHSNLWKDNMYKRKYFSRVHDNLVKLSDMVIANREITSDIRDNYLSLNSYQTNRLITVLTIFAAIFTPLTFIAGVYGMNFDHMPELHWANGYYIVLAVMLLIAFLMFFWFKIKGWFK